MGTISTALISVFDKTGIVDLAKDLRNLGIKILSTGGTAKTLRETGVEITDVSDYTGFPEMMDGRVKTLHPKVHGGLLCIRGNQAHEEAARKNSIQMIDLVVVNLYPFEQTIAKPGVTLEEAIENIDIGGPSMLRSGAKNHKSVTVVPDPKYYASLMEELEKNKGGTSLEFRWTMAKVTFSITGLYDAEIYRYFCKMS